MVADNCVTSAEMCMGWGSRRSGCWHHVQMRWLTCAGVCSQITSPSGKALFQWRALQDGLVDFYICALSFGKNAIGQRQRIGATVSVYLNGTFIWCAHSISCCELDIC